MLWGQGGGRMLHLNENGTLVVLPLQSFEKYTALATRSRR
jgi:hypothetical protein